jgi:hypothetical protein
MASTQMCDTHPDRGAMFILHNLENVEFMGLCPECLTGFAIAWLQTVQPDMLAKAPARGRGKKAPESSPALANDSESGEADATAGRENAGTAAG